MKYINRFVYLIVFLCLPLTLFANNVHVDNVVLTGQNTTDHYTLVQFDISWDNSWRNIVNWDAAWIFVKYKGPDNLWKHARLGLNDPDHTAPTGSVINSTNFNDSYAPGVFIYREVSSGGSNDWNNVQLRWNYGENGLLDNDLVTVKVFAIEMVYVPQSTFDLGDGSGGSTSYHFYDAGLGNSQPFIVNAQGAITMSSSGSGNLWSSPGQIEAGTSDAEFPTGYNAFYSMKYEITQEQYVDFLNTLTRTQQNTRTETDISSTSITNRYVMSSSSTLESRNGIRCDATILASGAVNIYSDYDSDNNPNEDNDGQNIACNYLSWMDGCAYASWAGLRPMTELEYEKACRGDQVAIAGEFAWGNASIHAVNYTLLNAGFYSEVISSQPSGIGNASYSSTDGSINGPVRAGTFALLSTSRQEAGASYYGIMELSGNLRDHMVTVGNADGRVFTGNHGGGGLSSNGNANNVASWPGWDGSEVIGASGAGFRGGAWLSGNLWLRVSHRSYAVSDNSDRISGIGFRCVRSAP